MDEAFLTFETIIRQMIPSETEIIDEENGIRSHIYEIEIESPIELDISAAEDGKVQIGTTPPLHNVRTSFIPSFHKIRFTAEIAERDGN